MDNTNESIIIRNSYKELEQLHNLNINPQLKDYDNVANEHFCNALLNDASLDSFRDKTPKTTLKTTVSTPKSSIKICEKYAPSYTSKKEQINRIYDGIEKLRSSKQLMIETMKKLDEFLEDDKSNNSNESEIERFFKSSSCLSSSLNISSLNLKLPRTDIKPPRYMNDLNKNISKTEKADRDRRYHKHCFDVPTSIFEPYNRYTFTDKTLLDKKKLLDDKKKPQLNKRISSAGFSLSRKSDSDRGTSNKNNDKLKIQLNLKKPRISSAH